MTKRSGCSTELAQAEMGSDGSGWGFQGCCRVSGDWAGIAPRNARHEHCPTKHVETSVTDSWRQCSLCKKKSLEMAKNGKLRALH